MFTTFFLILLEGKILSGDMMKENPGQAGRGLQQRETREMTV
jgi:hypothetical protein